MGIKASKLVGYDYGVMYFDNQKNVSFSEVIPMVTSGVVEGSFLANRMPYETGALLFNQRFCCIRTSVIDE